MTLFGSFYFLYLDYLCLDSKVRVHNRFWFSYKFKPGSIQFDPGFFITETEIIEIRAINSLPNPVSKIAKICDKSAKIG